MASNFVLKSLAILALTLAVCVQGSPGGITCENLNKDTCAFAVSSSGKRCVLEKPVRSGEEAYVCRTSEIEADNVTDSVESDQCIEACGLDRKSHILKLCSTQCYNSCPNIVDLYFNLTAGEGNLQTPNPEPLARIGGDNSTGTNTSTTTSTSTTNNNSTTTTTTITATNTYSNNTTTTITITNNYYSCY